MGKNQNNRLLQNDNFFVLIVGCWRFEGTSSIHIEGKAAVSTQIMVFWIMAPNPADKLAPVSMDAVAVVS
jgi:hypothetical protein